MAVRFLRTHSALDDPARAIGPIDRSKPITASRYHAGFVTPADYARARRLLMRRDPVLAALIKRHGPCGLAAAQRADHLTALVRAITFQQLSTKAAGTIYGRLMTLMPDGRPDAGALASLTDDQFRGVGMSRQKIGYLRDLAQRVASRSLDLDTLDRLSDDEVVVALTQVKGIGRWSADMFLMFRLHRPDVLPVGDLGIVNAMRRTYRMRRPPTPDRMRRIAEAWRPYRSVACVFVAKPGQRALTFHISGGAAG